MSNLDQPIADSVPQAAFRLGISRSQCYIEIAAGRLRAVKAQRRTLVTRDDQTAWLGSLPPVCASEAA